VTARDVPTVAALRARLAPLRAQLAEKDALTKRLEPTCGPGSDGACDCGAYEDAALDAALFDEHEVAPLEAQLAAAEAAARETRTAERERAARLIESLGPEIVQTTNEATGHVTRARRLLMQAIAANVRATPPEER
jgi:hypothetical protein